MIGTQESEQHNLVDVDHQVNNIPSQADRIVPLEQGRTAWENRHPFSPAHPFFLRKEREAYPTRPSASLHIQPQNADVTFKDCSPCLRDMEPFFNRWASRLAADSIFLLPLTYSRRLLRGLALGYSFLYVSGLWRARWAINRCYH